MFWWNYFCNNYRKYYKRKCSKGLFCNNFGQDGNERGCLQMQTNANRRAQTQTNADFRLFEKGPQNADKRAQTQTRANKRKISGRKKAHKHKLFALVNVQMTLGQTVGCPRVNRAKKSICSPRKTGNTNFPSG